MNMAQRLIPRDAIAGALFVAFGLTFAALAMRYPLGSAMRMGPGYFPALLGLILSVIGMVIVLAALRPSSSEDREPHGDNRHADRSAPAPHSRLRPVLLISASVLLFAVAIEPFGLALATFAVVAVSSLADREARWPQLAASGVVLPLITVGVFAYGLRLPFKVIPF
jgi:hypothetical protein